MKIGLHSLLFLLISWYSQAQTGMPSFSGKADSCHLTVYHVVTKEMIAIDGRESKKELGTVAISKRDTEYLLGKLNRKSSLRDSGSMLTHYNLVFNVYQNESPAINITVSTITGKISINNLASDQSFYGSVSRKLGRYLLKILSDYKVVDLIDSQDLAGLR